MRILTAPGYGCWSHPKSRSTRYLVTIASRSFAAMLKIGPAITRNIAVERDVAIPVILLRSPYGRGGVHSTMARLFAERGYHAVVQFTRGTFGCEGRIDFDREAADGRSAADWIVDQPWSNGVLGTCCR
jgi:hypothetical protein